MAQQMKYVPSLMEVVSAQMDTMESIASLVSLITIVSITKMREYEWGWHSFNIKHSKKK